MLLLVSHKSMCNKVQKVVVGCYLSNLVAYNVQLITHVTLSLIKTNSPSQILVESVNVIYQV